MKKIKLILLTALLINTSALFSFALDDEAQQKFQQQYSKYESIRNNIANRSFNHLHKAQDLLEKEGKTILPFFLNKLLSETLLRDSNNPAIIQLVKTLLDLGANPNGNDGRILVLAFSQPNDKIIKMLINHGADLSILYHDKFTKGVNIIQYNKVDEYYKISKEL